MAIPAGVGIWYTSHDTSGLAGWSRNTDFDDKFIKGVASGGSAGNGTGGAANHTHDQAGHTHDYTTAGPSATTLHSTSWMRPVGNSEHTHDGTSGSSSPSGTSGASTGTSWDSKSSDPTFYAMVYIESDGTPAGYPQGSMVYWDNRGTLSTLPTGWSQKSETVSKYHKGAAGSANQGATGGGNHYHTESSHSHSVASHTHLAANCTADDNTSDWAYTPLSNYSKATVNHLHSVTLDTGTPGNVSASTDSGGNSGNDAVEPPFINLMLIKNDSAGVVQEENAIVMYKGAFNAAGMSDWQLCDGSSATNISGQGTIDMQSKYVKGSASGGGDTGSSGGATDHTGHSQANHTHTIAHTHTYPTTGACNEASNGQSGNWGNWCASGTHTHAGGTTDSGTTPLNSRGSTPGGANNGEPAYREVGFYITPEAGFPNVPFFGTNF